MTSRKYYSVRSGKNLLASKLSLPIFLRLFYDLFTEFNMKDYFQEAFGYKCVDYGFIPGKLGSQIDAQIFRKLRKENIWPIDEKYTSYSEDDVFDVVEFLYDQVSKPLEGFYHDYSDCGWHYRTFDIVNGRREFCLAINELLQDYGNGFELSEEGEILILPEIGLEKLLEANMPNYDPENIESRVNAAINKFRRYKSSQDDRKDAIKDLIDVLEFLRPKLKNIISKKDENDLFEIANQFGIRHHRFDQKTNYDKSIWYSWMFYYYLATIHAAVRLIKRETE